MEKVLTAYLNIFVIFALMFLGYLLTWKKWFDNMIADTFSKLVLNFALPASMFLNITQKFSKDQFLHLFKGMLLPITSILVTFVISIIYAKLTKVPRSRQGTFETMFTASNTIFIGLPINLAIFGEVAVPYVLLYYICNTTFFWTIGVYLIATDSPGIKQSQIKFNFFTAIKQIFSPALLGFIVGLFWLLLGIPTPHFVKDFLGYLGDLTTPLSMLFIGTIVYFTGITNLKMNKDTFGVLLGRYLISPLVVLGLSYIIPIPPMMLKVFIIQSAMPVQNSVPILTRSYKADTEFSTTSLTYSVLLYLFIIPILLHFVF